MKSQQVIQTIPYVSMKHFLWYPIVYFMSSLHRNWRIEKGSYRIREGRLKKIFQESRIRELKISKQGMTLYGLGRAIYKLTSLGEGFLSKLKPLGAFSGYYDRVGRKRQLICQFLQRIGSFFTWDKSACAGDTGDEVYCLLKG
jgi:hypothetical protein